MFDGGGGDVGDDKYGSRVTVAMVVVASAMTITFLVTMTTVTAK